MKRRRVGIFVYDGADHLDIAGPAEVLSLASKYKAEQLLMLYHSKLMPTRPFHVCTISAAGQPIQTHTGVRIHPDYSFADAPELDILIIPGGSFLAVKALSGNREVANWIKRHQNVEYICSVCTGSFILNEAGLLDGKRVTTHHLAADMLQRSNASLQVESKSKIVHDGHIVTSGGVTSGINMALYLVRLILGDRAAARTAAYIEFSEPATDYSGLTKP
ncbi:DJ-1/PfpI family protein [Paenibacillus thiaminolyticus]|uniref:DJ-1/PfpI family protein n=1 Tax=Paenibacillus thiaminolyticus TaxID=49283 RepID=A0A3A3GCL6_PANTH|nr:DJ-1/PfpI family protein [Paenibacillus thiaminolyticus]RJG20429.1 DJ-1/PfpI family protein [Paenibacillus thiaminolyticus]